MKKKSLAAAAAFHDSQVNLKFFSSFSSQFAAAAAVPSKAGTNEKNEVKSEKREKKESELKSSGAFSFFFPFHQQNQPFNMMK